MPNANLAAGLIGRSVGKTRADLLGSPEIKRFHDKLTPLLRGSDIAKVKIYSLPGITVFSTEAAQIGEDKSGNAGFIAASNGEVFSELVHRNQFSASEGDMLQGFLYSRPVPVDEFERLIELAAVVATAKGQGKKARRHDGVTGRQNQPAAAGAAGAETAIIEGWER